MRRGFVSVRQKSVAIRDVVMEEDIAFKKRELKLIKEARATDLTADASNLTREKLRPKQIELVAQLDAILDYLKKQTSDAEVSSVISYKQGKIFMWVLGAISIVLGVLISSAITRSIVLPIREAVRVAKKIAEGDLTSRIAIKGNDELATLLKVLSNMNDRLAQVIGPVKQSAQVVTRSSVNLSDATERVAKHANNQAKQVREMGAASELVTLSIAEVATTAGHSIVTDADAVNELAQGIVSSTRDQEAASSETATGMEKISAITDENANSLKQVDSAASALAETATELQNLVDQFRVSA